MASSGQIRTKPGVTYDFEDDPTYEVTVTAADQDGNSTTITVNITLTDVDEPPLRPAAPVVVTSTGSHTSLEVSWSAPENTGRPPITDYDLQYRRIGGSGQNCNNWCSGDHTGTATETTLDNLESGTRYEVQVQAKNDEGDSPWSPSGRGTTTDEDNAAPAFDPLPTLEFEENIGSDTTVAPVDIGTLTATDENEGDTLTFELVGVNASLFTLVNNNDGGLIRSKRGVNYDHEANPTYTLTVRVQDNRGASSTTDVTINVTDREERPKAPAAPTVTTGTTPTSHLAVTWTPADNAGRPPITDYDVQYRKNGTSDSWTPRSHTGTGTNTTISSLEAGTEYEVQVLARNDDGASDWSASGTGRTAANNTNNVPSFSEGSSITRSFPENVGSGYNVGSPVTASDADDDPLTYTLEGADASSFTIVSSSGQIRTRSGVRYDYEAKDTYHVVVKADDRNGGTDAIAVTINVLDVVNESGRGTGTTTGTRNPSGDDGGDSAGAGGPAFEASSTERSFPENTPPGENIGAPVTVDDNGNAPLMTYELQGPDAVSFDVEPKTGQIKTKAGVSYDYETRDAYAVTVKATDSRARSDTVAVTIRVTDVAEKPATPEAPTVSAPEGSSTSLAATWMEPNRNGGPPIIGYNVEYRQGTGGDWINWPHSGTDTTATITGLRPHTEYQVRVQALNGELPSDWSPPGTGQTNNAAPVFVDSATTRSFAENTPPGQNIGASVSAEDAEGEPLEYTLEGADATSFDIEPQTGQLKTKSGVNYDYETTSSYSVTVRATDPHGANAAIDVTINVTNVPEKPATPEAPTVTAPDGSTTSLAATWTAPGLNGGSPLTGYDVQYGQGASGAWIDWPHTGTATTTTITQLAAGTDYQVRVRALGEVPSDWSPPGSGRTGSVSVTDWVERFGRSIAQQMMEGVEERLAFPCRTGLQGTVAGRGFGGDRSGSAGLSARRWAGSDPATLRLHEPRLLGEHDAVATLEPALLAGTDFELAGETTGGGIACVWGRGAYASFHGREGQFALDGNVRTGTLGADYQMDPWTVGLALSHSRGEGRDGSDDIEAALTGLFPYAGYQVTKRLSVWGLGGFGRGGLTVTPRDGTSRDADVGLLMIGAGLRSLLLSSARGVNVAFETDGFWVHAASDGTPGLRATKADANRLRFGLESSYEVALKYGGTLTPRFEIGWRYDGGDADTGLGVDIGGGLVWWAPAGGITAEIEVRRVLMHEATGFNDWSVSGLVRYDPYPFSERGVSASLRSTSGLASLGSVGGLLDRDTLTELSVHDAGDGRLTAELAYGFPFLGGRFTGAPWAGAGVLGSGRDYRLGYRISSAGLSASGMRIGIEGVRRENGGGDAGTEHAIGLRLGLGW